MNTLPTDLDSEINDVIKRGAMIDSTTNSTVSDYIAPLISERAFWWIRLFAYTIFGKVLALAGSAINIINIVVFTKAGLGAPMNISFLGLAISDLAACFFLLCFYGLVALPNSEALRAYFVPGDIALLFAIVPHKMFLDGSYCINCFITVQRLLCVIYPLKIKRLITRKIAIAVLTTSCLLNICIFSPMYAIHGYAWVFDPVSNATLFVMTSTANAQAVRGVVILIGGLLIPLLTFFATALSAALLAIKLRKKAEWRRTFQAPTTASTPSAVITNDATFPNSTKTTKDVTTKNTSPASTSTTQAVAVENKTSVATKTKEAPTSMRDLKAAKMVVVVAVVYIVTCLPVNAIGICILFMPDLFLGNVYERTGGTILAISYIFELMNACLNIFVYYTMSSNYRETLDKILRRRRS